MTDSNARAADLVRTGFAAQNAGDVAAAETAYLQALRLQPGQPDALQLLGLMERRRGNLGAAEDFMRQSLRARPAQPHVWNNLGNLLEKAGHSAEAEASFDEALRLQPGYADAHYNRARVLHAAGRLQPAHDAARQALACAAPATARLLLLKALIESDGNNVPAALATVEMGLQMYPDDAALLHNRATLLQRSARYAQALESHEQARARGLDAADAHYNRGNTLQSLGRQVEAVAAYREALARQPDHRLALLDLARLRWRMGDPNFDAELRGLERDQPSSAVGPGMRAHLLWRAERFDASAQAFEEALRREPQTAGYLDGLGRCRVRQGRVDEGLAAQAQAVSLAPADAELRTNHAASLLIARRLEAAQAEAEIACALAPDDQYALALLGLAWRLRGDPRERWLNDYERFVRPYDLLPPPGYVDIDAFNAALAQELATQHVDRIAPVDQTLRQGTQTLGTLFEQRLPLVGLLQACIAKAIDDYIGQLPEDASHPFLHRSDARWVFTDSWSSRLSSGGFHTHHVHPHGWLSSVYYVGVPPASADAAQRQGWLQFGAPDIEVGLGPEAGRRLVQPKSGRLVLFPSMFWHGTLPFTDTVDRLTVAFDVKPA